MRKLRERPIQIYLRPDQDAALRALAKQENVAIAELVRRGVDRIIADIPIEHDPLLDLIGIGNAGVRDLSENHDYYIIEALLAESQPKPQRKTIARAARKKRTGNNRKRIRSTRS